MAPNPPTTPQTPVSRTQSTSQPATTQPVGARGQRVKYSRGLTINFARRRVEVDCVVVLREGLLELLACSPRTKEHESILRAVPRPLRVYEALGLIGLTPGAPAEWDADRQRRIPPTGDRLTIRIAYELDGRHVEVNAWDWIQSAETGLPAKPRPWIFTGSLKDARGRFAADYDGNVISLVDFGTELIGLPDMLSPDNDQLFLQANPDRIPPRSTPCSLLLQPFSSSDPG